MVRHGGVRLPLIKRDHWIRRDRKLRPAVYDKTIWLSAPWISTRYMALGFIKAAPEDSAGDILGMLGDGEDRDPNITATRFNHFRNEIHRQTEE